jgi:PPOX class probable FMN-dependent enzyme
MDVMTDTAAPTRQISSPDELDELYGTALPRSLTKELDHLNRHYRMFVEKAPFVVVATSGPGGLDCSPRGDPPGFVRVVDDKTVMIPDRRGNNRLDTLRNLVGDPRISLLFLIPGVGETLRVNGRAEILVDGELNASFAVNGKLPKSVIRVTVDSVYYQCQKALARSRLWEAGAQIDRSDLPSAGQMNKSFHDGDFDAEAYDRDYPQRMKDTMY